MRVLLRSVEKEQDPALLQFMDNCVDKCVQEVVCRVSDKHILQRQLTGYFTPGVAHVKGKRGLEAADVPASKMFRGAPVSAISGIQAKQPAPASKGNGDHLPQSSKTYCEYCNKWIAICSFAKHKRESKKHKESESSLKATGSKCACDTSLVIVLFCISIFVADTWCQACQQGFIMAHECAK
jgi:hypothetical protein